MYNDASVEVSKIKAIEAPPANEDGLLVRDIWQYGIEVNVLSFKYINHLCNGVAHSLARQALRLLSPCLWSFPFEPPWIIFVLAANAASSMS